MLHQILYVSVQKREFTKEDLQALLEQSRRKNERLGITGILIHYKKHFFQVLEGEKERVFELLQTIRQDQRHLSVILVFDQPIEERNFREWTMAFLNLNEMEKSSLRGFSEFLEKGFTSEITTQHLSIAQQLVAKFKRLLDTGR